jgi:hypothetical protein
VLRSSGQADVDLIMYPSFYGGLARLPILNTPSGGTMRNLLIGLLLGILLAVAVAYTQQQPEQIHVGMTTLQIGMAKDTAISQLAEKSYHLSKGESLTKGEGEETWAVAQKNDHNEFDLIGMLTFTNGRLTWASRIWASTTDPGSAKLGRNLYFLLKSFEDSGNVACTIESETSEAPELDSKGVSIHCGKRTAKVYVVKYKEQEPATSLDETIK